MQLSDTSTVDIDTSRTRRTWHGWLVLRRRDKWVKRWEREREKSVTVPLGAQLSLSPLECGGGKSGNKMVAG